MGSSRPPMCLNSWMVGGVDIDPYRRHVSDERGWPEGSRRKDGVQTHLSNPPSCVTVRELALPYASTMMKSPDSSGSHTSFNSEKAPKVLGETEVLGPKVATMRSNPAVPRIGTFVLAATDVQVDMVHPQVIPPSLTLSEDQWPSPVWTRSGRAARYGSSASILRADFNRAAAQQRTAQHRPCRASKVCVAFTSHQAATAVCGRAPATDMHQLCFPTPSWREPCGRVAEEDHLHTSFPWKPKDDPTARQPWHLAAQGRDQTICVPFLSSAPQMRVTRCRSAVVVRIIA